MSSLVLNSKQYFEYLKLVAKKIASEGDYISMLDAATGDGDHWANINMGFSELINSEALLTAGNMRDCFKNIGMSMMSTIGGSSGVLYGGAYIAAAKTINSNEINAKDLCTALRAMVDDMMSRGNSKPGYKTMIDALYPAVVAFEEGLATNKDEQSIFKAVKQAAIDGAEATKSMPAVRGRASYQADKGIGHLDPGAVTMSYQISILMDYLAELMA